MRPTELPPGRFAHLGDGGHPPLSIGDVQPAAAETAGRPRLSIKNRSADQTKPGWKMVTAKGFMGFIKVMAPTGADNPLGIISLPIYFSSSKAW